MLAQNKGKVYRTKSNYLARKKCGLCARCGCRLKVNKGVRCEPCAAKNRLTTNTRYNYE